MLFFLDESFQTLNGVPVGSLGAVGIPQHRYNHFCGIVHAVKKETFGQAELTDFEMKGNYCFSKSVFKVDSDPILGPAKWLHAADRIIDALQSVDGVVIALWTDQPSLLSLRNTAADRLTGPYMSMLHHFCRVMSTRPANERGHLYFDQLGHREDKHAATTLANYMARIQERAVLRKYLIQVPHYTHSVVSPGLQMADLVAYLAANQFDPSARPELKPWWERFEAMATCEVPRRKRKGTETRETAEAYVQPRRLRRL